MLFCACHSFCAVKDKISNPDGVELDGAIMEPCDVEFIERLSEEGITLDRGEEVKSFSKCCVVKLFLERVKAMGTKCYFDRQHDLRPIRQHERCFSCCCLFGRMD